ncbi:MAG: flavin reductase family protein [Candidatus Muirbacterium halophilum]|nr:flavin reductase family protein [Candidatus Muirbacterium halophilum]MCK9474834.1 flavin reductase family protein [Candidatus Muirbacterium halophilum]
MNFEALHKLNYGLYIVSSGKDNNYNGCIVNTVFQITSDPATIAVSVNKKNLTNKFMVDSGKFTVSILTESAPMTFIGPFGFRCGSEIDKFENVKYNKGKNSIPYLTEHVCGFIEADIVNSVDVGTHTLFIGQITNMDVISVDKPMTYAYYHEVKKGKTPEKAATFIKGEK